MVWFGCQLSTWAKCQLKCAPILRLDHLDLTPSNIKQPLGLYHQPTIVWSSGMWQNWNLCSVVTYNYNYTTKKNRLCSHVSADHVQKHPWLSWRPQVSNLVVGIARIFPIDHGWEFIEDSQHLQHQEWGCVLKWGFHTWTIESENTTYFIRVNKIDPLPRSAFPKPCHSVLLILLVHHIV